ncbi:hypothetical protein G8S21_12490, partial [Clostridium botulinum C]|nr:hypothetical protein [Clostridium botulinum C]
AFCYIAKKLYQKDNWEDLAFDIFDTLQIEEIESISSNRKILKPSDYKIISNKIQSILEKSVVAIDG